MTFLYEKQTRRYCIFLGAFCMALLIFCLLAGRVQAQGTKNAVLSRERSIASSLLSSGVKAEVIAAAYGNDEITPEGMEFLEKTGRSQHSDPRLLPAVRESASAFLLFMGSGAFGLSLLLLGGTWFYLSRREALYREAAEIIAEFSEGRFERHLKRDREGTLYQMFDEVDRLSMALQAKGEAALRAKEGLKDALSDISHQLKTPLAALFMYMEIILGETERPEAVREFGQKSVESLERMETLIQTLLKVMRLDAGNISFEKREVRVSELAAEATRELRLRAHRENKRLVTKGDPEELLFCDPVWTVEALSNLVKNALDHMEAGGTVQIGWERSPTMLRIWVADDGCGIAEEEMPHIFKRFYRSKASLDTAGAGLGLPLAKSITEGQQGTMSAASRPGEGAVFTMSFLTEP